MSTQIPNVTLQTAVMMQVKDFASSNTPFSVHDITRTIRKKVYNNELEIPEVTVTGTSYRFDIPHAKVKELFNELWQNGIFDPDFTLNRSFNGTYFEYSPTSTVGSTNVPLPSSVIQPSTTLAPSKVITPTFNTGNSVTKNRIKNYLERCDKRGFNPTLKNVQSAIKRGNKSTGWTCEMISKLIDDELPYIIFQNSTVYQSLVLPK